MSADAIGRAAELKVKIFGGRSSENVLQQEIGEWLAENGGAEVYEIQYRYDVCNSAGWYSAMIVYR